MLRPLLLIIGVASLGLGVVGIFLPLLPTTPFVLLAAWCFAKSSRRLHQLLLDSPRFGPAIAAWRTHRAIPKPAKIAATIMSLPTIALASLQPPQITARLLVIGGMLAVLAFIWSRPSSPNH